MIKRLATLALLFFSVALNAQNGRTISPFDDNWKFFKGDATGAEQTSFDASTWTDVKLPHDWSIYGPYDRNNTTGSGGGYLPSDIGWYRNSFSLTNKDAGKKFSIEFDGIMANSDVWINGHHLGKRPSGYVSLSYDLTPYLKFDGVNLIAVRADNSIQPASRWYTGAGIVCFPRVHKNKKYCLPPARIHSCQNTTASFRPRPLRPAIRVQVWRLQGLR